MKTKPGIMQSWAEWKHAILAALAAWAVIGALLFFLIRPAASQEAVPVSSWVTELTAGAAAVAVMHGPWIAKSWQTPGRRVALATALSLAYEYGVEPWNGQTNAAVLEDAYQRLVGTIGAEAAIALAGKLPDWLNMTATSALIVVDWGQTLDFRRRGFAEGNPIMGPYPSRGQVNTVIGIGLAANLATRALPKRLRTGIWGAVLFRESVAVVRNAAHPGAGFSFSF